VLQGHSPVSREAAGSSRTMNAEFVSALHHNHRAIGTATQQLVGTEQGAPEQVQTAVSPCTAILPCLMALNMCK
jgi:hypothetical protein